MKRVYESPVMMVEGFESNEYVAACWDVYCKGCTDDDVPGTLVKGWGVITGTPSQYEHKHTGDNYLGRVKSETELDSKTIYYSPWGIGSQSYTESKSVASYNGHWIVGLEPIASDDPHPNASM